MNGHSHELEENFRQDIYIFYANYRLAVLLQLLRNGLVGSLDQFGIEINISF